MMHIFLMSFVILFFITSCDSGWVLNKTLPLSMPIKQILWASDQTIIMQTNESIYTALLDTPDVHLRSIVDAEPQDVVIAKSTHNSSFAYSLPPYVSYEETGNSKIKYLKEFKQFSNFVISRRTSQLYFYNPQISPHLLIFSLVSERLTEGPLLEETDQDFSFFPTLKLDKEQNYLHIAFNKSLFIINLQTMGFQKIVEDNEGVIIGLLQTITSETIITQNQYNQYRLYRFNPSDQNYRRIYFSSAYLMTTSIRISYIPAEQPDFLYQIKLTDTSFYYKKRIVKFSAAQPYEKIVDRIENKDKNLLFHKLGDDLRTVYSFFDIKGQGQNIIKSQIINSSLHVVQSFPIYFNQRLVLPKIVRISKSQLLFFTGNNQFFIWDLKKNRGMCAKEIENNLLSNKQMINLEIDPQIQYIYLTTKDSPETLVSLEIDTCQIKFKTYDVTIAQIIFHQGFLLLSTIADIDNLYKIDKRSMEMIETYTKNGLLIELQGNIYGIYQLGQKVKVYRLDDNYQVQKEVDCDCGNSFQNIKAGKNHIVAICDNQYTLFSPQLEYLGNSVLLEDKIIVQYVEQTFDQSLRFDRSKGKLHKSIFDKWEKNISIYNDTRIVTNLYFYNTTHFLCLATKEHFIFLTVGKLKDLDLQFLRYQPLGIKWNTILLAQNPLRWSCDKSYIIFQYVNRIDAFNIYINIYKTTSLQLVYTYFISSTQQTIVDSVSNHFRAYMGCNDVLYVYRNGWIDQVDINKKKTVISYQIQSTHSLAIDYNARFIMIAGQNTEGMLLEVWSVETESLYNTFKITMSQSVFYIVQDVIFSLRENQLYQFSKENSTLIHGSIQGCDYLNSNSLICLTTTSEFVQINASHSSKLSHSLFQGKGQLISTKDLIIVYNNGQLAIHSSLPPFQALQTITLQQQRSNLVAVSPDSQQILTYDQQKKSLSYWIKGQCPKLAELNNGICECIQGQRDGVCTCGSGFLELEGKCTKCLFFCKQCQGSEGSCLSLNAGGIFMILGLSLIPILVGLAICCYFRKRKHKKDTSVIMQELLEQQCSINED